MLNVVQLAVSFSIYNASVDSAVAEVSVSFIVPAVRKAVAENDEEDPSHTTVCFDSSWQNVGRNFLNDILSVTSLGTGEVLHVEIMSKFCFVFHSNLTSKHKCEKKYGGSSDGMEGAGVLDFFNCFLRTQGICYTKNLGDENSNDYQMVVAEKTYGPYISVTKL